MSKTNIEITPTIYLSKVNKHRHGVILGSKDMRTFHLVRRLKTGTDSYGSNLALFIQARYTGFR
jgi:hypothetical protein